MRNVRNALKIENRRRIYFPLSSSSDSTTLFRNHQSVASDDPVCVAVARAIARRGRGQFSEWRGTAAKGEQQREFSGDAIGVGERCNDDTNYVNQHNE